MKNYDTIVPGLIDAMFEDMASAISVSDRTLSHSREYCTSAYAKRGLPFYTITLPSCCKFLEKSLEEGRIVDDRPPYHGALSSEDKRPRFLYSLWCYLFDSDGLIMVDPSDHAVFWLRQFYNVLKKLDMECAQEYVDEEISQYLRIESELPSSLPNTWDSDVPEWKPCFGHPLWGVQSADSRQNQLTGLDLPVHSDNIPWGKFRLLCANMSSSFGLFDVWAIRPKHGPGAIAEGSRTIKYEFRSWPRKLNAIFPADYFASPDLVDRSDDDNEIPAVLHAVPKTQKGPRLIASEPSSHQWIQGGIQRWFEDRIRSTFLGNSIDFRSQEYSRQLALEASRTGDYATVDLSAASDRLSTRLVQFVFQGNQSLLDALHACRSRAIRIPSGTSTNLESDVLIKLRKFAPMGSACTFPVQTIVFTMIGHLALCMADDDWDCTVDGMRRRASRLRVFGDDIIIDNHAYSHLVRILSSCGLKVNEGKSYSKGRFREACGMDAFDGVDVTPAYIRKLYHPSKPESLASLVTVSNNFHKKGLWRTAQALLKTVPDSERKLIAISQGDIGSLSIFTYVKGPLSAARRWNRELHGWEYRILTISGRTDTVQGSGEASLLQFFNEDPAGHCAYDWHSGQATRARLSKRVGWVRVHHPEEY